VTDETEAAAMLRSSSRLRDDADFETYERAVELLAESLDPRDLPTIYRAFDDGTEDYEVFWSLVHLIDKYDWRTTATVYVDLLPETLATAREWMELLAIRQVNHDEARRLLLEAARAAPAPNRDALRTLLVGLASERDSDAAKALAIRAEQALHELDDRPEQQSR
jgi:immunity protein 30 of polymorphic toxin system